MPSLLLKERFRPGSSTRPQFIQWMVDRHTIWIRREQGQAKPWSDDPIFQTWKFTNVFRQLDPGTITLARLYRPHVQSAALSAVAWNILWYRLFNLESNARHGFVADPEHDRYHLYDWLREQPKVFTSSYMLPGVAREPKVETYIRIVDQAWRDIDKIVGAAQSGSLQSVFRQLLNIRMIGRFTAYEIVSDLRFVEPLWPGGEPFDVLTWANLGPGAARSLARLGLMELDYEDQALGVRRMIDLLLLSRAKREPILTQAPVPFELREIERSLSEFDHYERIRLGEGGRPRMRFAGR